MSSFSHIAIIAPCFNEAQIIGHFLDSIDTVTSSCPFSFEVIIVDDGSIDRTPEILDAFSFKSQNTTLTVLRLPLNQGHQNAIFQGMLYAKSTQAERFIIMDSDGQDNPQLIEEMLSMTQFYVVHVNRKKRGESLAFRLGYRVYKAIFRVITGKTIHFGNYSMITRKVLEGVINEGFVHYPALLSQYTLERGFILADREVRQGGKSKMSFITLLNHAVKSFIQYSEKLMMICLWVFIALSIALTISVGYVFYQKLFTDNAILGWASNITLGLFNGTLISLSAFVIGTQLLKNAQKTNQVFNAEVLRNNKEQKA